MNWQSIGDLLAMGGYGLYVWGSFGMVAACMLAESWLVRRRWQRSLRAARTAPGERP